MTAPLLGASEATVLGRRLKDCEDGLILIIVGVDREGDYLVCDTEGGPQGLVLTWEVHETDASHQPCQCEPPGSGCLDCYEWISGGPQARSAQRDPQKPSEGG